jgi:glycosyltransferase involved in cell wall biosynthesis
MKAFDNHKPTLVVVLPRFPYPLEKGDKLRAYYQIIGLSEVFNVVLFAVNDADVPQSSLDKLSGYCSRIEVFKRKRMTIAFNLFLCLFSRRPFQVGFFYSNKNARRMCTLLKEINPDHIYCQLIRAAEYIKDYHDCPKTIDYMDALSKGMERRIDHAPWYAKRLFRNESIRLKNYEVRIFDYFEHASIISIQDQAFIFHPKRKNIHCIPNGITPSFFDRPQIETDKDIVFIGNLSYAPNIEAVEYISSKILSASKHISCLIAGATPTALVEKFCKEQHIELLGWVDDIREAYCRGRIFVAPMMIGTGMQNKLLEAMALGIPCVTTKLAGDPIGALDGESICIANNANEFVSIIQELLSNKDYYEKIARNGQDFVRQNYSWIQSNKQLVELIHKSSKE